MIAPARCPGERTRPNESLALGIGEPDGYGAARFAGSGAFTNLGANLAATA
jgi:hypothetical protein